LARNLQGDLREGFLMLLFRGLVHRFVHLFSGAPARAAARSPARATSRRKSTRRKPARRRGRIVLAAQAADSTADEASLEESEKLGRCQVSQPLAADLLVIRKAA